MANSLSFSDLGNYQSIGKNLTGGTTTTLFTVPTGFNIRVLMLFIANAGGSSATYSATWEDGTSITFQGTKNLGAGSYDIFGGSSGGLLVMNEGESITVTTAAGSTFTVIATIELIRHAGTKYNIS